MHDRAPGWAADAPIERFRGLLLRHRGRTGLTQRQLAERLGVHVRSVQDWEAGLSHPTGTRLERLVAVLVQTGAFMPGRELAEAQALWSAATSEGRSRAPFDVAWFASLLASVPPQAAGPPPADRSQDWGEAPDTSRFLGRETELATVHHWIVEQHARVVQIVGLGGVGKTLLATRAAQAVAPRFGHIFWRTLRHALAPGEWLAAATAFLDPDGRPATGSEPAQVAHLLGLLRARRCLLVLDNLEALLTEGHPAGRFRPGFETYGVLLEELSMAEHQSCLLVTSREDPGLLAPLVGSDAPLRVLRLGGLDVASGRALLAEAHLSGDEAAWAALVRRCAGNPLALKLVAADVHDLFGGDISAFLGYGAPGTAMPSPSLRRVIEDHLGRLSAAEQQVVRLLAIEREPLTVHELASLLEPTTARGIVAESVAALWRRSLVQRAPSTNGLGLPTVVLEHVTEQLVADAVTQLTAGQWTWLLHQPLVRATAPDFVRQAQERVIGAAVLAQLTRRDGSPAAVEQRLLHHLRVLRDRPPASQGYVPGSVVNLLRLLRGELRHLDLSGLTIRQAYLQEVEAQDASLVGAQLGDSVLADAFDDPVGVAVSGDGRLLASGTYGGDLRVWRLPERAPVLAVTSHHGMIPALGMSADGQLLASASLDGDLNLWDLASGRLRASVVADPAGIWSLALRADGRVAITGGADGTVKVWDTGRGAHLATLVGHHALVPGVTISDDGRLAASCGSDGTIILWDLAAARARRRLPLHPHGAWAVGLSPDGRLLASGGLDGTVLVSETDTGERVATLEGHGAGVWAVALSPDATLVASSSFDRTVKLWDLPRGQLAATLPGSQSVYGLTLSRQRLPHGGWLLASASQDGRVRVWDSHRRECMIQLRSAIPFVFSLAMTADGRQAVAGSADGLIQVWDLDHGRLVRTLAQHTASVLSVALGQNDRLLVSGGMDGAVTIWDLGDGRPRLSLAADTMGVALSGDGRLVVSGGGEGLVKVWDVERGRLLLTLPGHVGPVAAVAVAGAPGMIASAGVDGTVRLWDLATGQPRAALHGHAGPVRALGVTPDAQHAVSGGVDGAVVVWSIARGEVLRRWPAHGSGVWTLALSRDGQQIASGGGDGTAKRWDLASGRLLAPPAGHPGLVLGVAVGGDGRVLASAGSDGTLRVWDAASATQHRLLRVDRCYERLDITGLRGISAAQHQLLLELGAIVRHEPAG
jgi:WD40 repeat protein/transcriptional regulator with XRE-family HTH domain